MVMIEGYIACTNPIAAFGYVSHTNQTQHWGMLTSYLHQLER